MRTHTVIADLTTYRGRFVSPLQLAEYVGITRRTIYHHIEKGALQVVRPGGKCGSLRIRIDEARRYAGEDRASLAS